MVRLALVAALVACSKPAPPPQAPPPPAPPPDAAELPLEQDLPRLAQRAVELYEAVATIFAEAGTDCAAASAKMTAARPTYAPVTTASARVLHEGRAADMRAALEPLSERLQRAGNAIATGPTMAACSSDAAFTAAFDALIGSPP